MTQLDQTAKRLSNKLKILAFDNHLTDQITRIRQIYLNSDLDIPNTFLDKISLETMTEFWLILQKTLQEESSVLYIEECNGLGIFVAVIMVVRYDSQCRGRNHISKRTTLHHDIHQGRKSN